MSERDRLDAAYGRRGGHLTTARRFDPETCQRCDVCGGSIVHGTRPTHHLCDPGSVVGRRCTCPPHCSADVVGDGGTCDGECHPCRVNQGRPVPGRRRSGQDSS